MKQGLFSRILPHLIAIVVFLVVAAIYCRPALEGMVLQQHDMVGAKGMSQNSWEYKETHGHFPLWNTHIFSGMPNYQVVVEGPKLLVNFTAIFTLGLPSPISFFFLACVCFYILTIALRIRPLIGILGSLAFAYCTYDPVIIAAGHTTKMLAIAYSPALLAGLVWLYEKRYWLGLAVSALFATTEITANHPQINYYLFFVIAFMSISYLVIWIRNKEWKHMAIAFSLAFLSALIGVGNSAVTFFTTADYTKYTMRGGKNIETTPTGAIVEKKTTGLDTDYAFSYSIRKSEIFTLLMPDAFGSSSSESLSGNSNFIQALEKRNVPDASAEQVASQLPKYWGGIIEGTAGPVYIGVMSCLLFVIGLAVLKTHHKWWILAAVLLATFMSWGKYFPSFNNILLDILPMYNKFRAPSMILVIPQLLIPLMAVMTLQDIFFVNRTEEEIKRDSKRALYAVGGLIALIGIVYLMNDYSADFDKNLLQQAGPDNGRTLVNALVDTRKAMFSAGLLRVFAFALGLLATLFLWRKKVISPVIAIVIFILLNTVDLLVVGRDYLNEENYIDKEEYVNFNFQATPADQTILKDTDPHYRVYLLTGGRFNSTPATARTMYFHRSVGGYHPAKLRIYQDLIENQLSKDSLNMAVLNMLDTRYFLLPDQQGQEVANVHRNDAALGAAWFVKSIQPVNGPAQEMKALDAFDPKQVAFFDKNSQNISSLPAWDSTASIRLTKYDNDTITYVTNAPKPQFAVFSEIYYPSGWNVYIDNKKADFYKVNYLLRGMPVPAGQHNITFRFEPASYLTGYRIAFMSTILLYLILAVTIYMIWRKNGPITGDPQRTSYHAKDSKHRMV